MDTKQFEDAIDRLAEMMVEYGKADTLDAVLKDAVKESLIQRFVNTHEMAWKTAKRYLVEIEGYPADIGLKSVIRMCGEMNLLDAETWLDYANARQSTSHDYSGKKASIALDAIKDFHSDATALCAALQNKILGRSLR